MIGGTRRFFLGTINRRNVMLRGISAFALEFKFIRVLLRGAFH